MKKQVEVSITSLPDADNSSVRTYPSLHNAVCVLLKLDHCDKS